MLAALAHQGRGVSEHILSLKEGNEGVITLRARKLTHLAAGALAACAAGAAPAVAQAAGLSGSGSTLVAPLEAEWASAWSVGSGVTVNFNASGSGQGIRDIVSGLTDFGASDAPLTSTQRGQCGNCVQLPWALSATAVGYNLGVKGLKLTGNELAQIYLGQITKWNDSRLKATNRGVKLPNEKITPVYRSDGSGDTYAFTNYLSDVNRQFASKVGYATSVQFPTGVSGSKNAGVTSVLQSTPGSIAYIAASYLIARHLKAVAIGNAAGHYEYPNLSNISAAARSVHSVPSTGELHIVNPGRGNRTAYPISTFTYVIAHGNNKQGGSLRSFIHYALTTGQQFGPALDFAPLPSVVKRAAESAVNRIQ